MSKMDTQGMSGEATEGCKDNIYPRDCLLYTSPSPRDRG